MVHGMLRVAVDLDEQRERNFGGSNAALASALVRAYPPGKRPGFAPMADVSNIAYRRAPQLRAARCGSAYGTRQCWTHKGRTPNNDTDHMGCIQFRLLRSTNIDSPPCTALRAAPPAPVASPWTPRMTHLRRPASAASLTRPPSVAAPPRPHSTTPPNSAPPRIGRSRSRLGIFGGDDDEMPSAVWPHHWVYDPHPRSKFR